MSRLQVIRTISTRVPVTSRATRPSRVSARRYATETEPKRPEADNTLLYSALGLAAVGGAYFYFRRNPSDAEKLKKKAHTEEEEMKQKARESAAAAKSRAGTAVEEGKQKYDDAKDAAKNRYGEARSDMDQKAEEVKAQGRSITNETKERSGAIARDVEARYDSAKQSVRRARDETEKLYDEARDASERKAREIRNDVEQVGADAKKGWFSWVGWGKSKVEEGEDKLRQEEKKAEGNTSGSKYTVTQVVSEEGKEVRR